MQTLLLLCAALVSWPLAAAESEFKTLLIKHWETAKEFTLAVAQAMPADAYDFKPNPEEISFGDLMVHIGDDNSGMCARVARTERLPKPATRDKQAAIKYLSETFEKCSQEIAGLTSDEWTREAYRFKGQPVLANEALMYMFTHMAHHRGQAEVYLRVKNIKPPAWRF